MPTPSRQSRPPIRVLLVDDSLLTLAILRRILARSPEIEVVGTATNGREALERIPQLQPDVICTDFHMPVMDGLELTREVMERFPRPILVLSVSVQETQVSTIFKLLEAGAIDVMAKPLGEARLDDGLDARELIRKIKILSGVVVIRRRRVETPHNDTTIPALEKSTPPDIIGIGASTGGPQAFQTILTQLPADFPVPLLCIQHISAEFMQGLVDWLDAQCRLKVRTAESGIVPQPGYAYFPQTGKHLGIDNQGRLVCSDDPAQGDHRPSINVTFSALARHYGARAAGVLLTGMGHDGVDGLRAIASCGGTTIAQDEQSSIVFGMPREAIAANAARYILPLTKIAPTLLTLLQQKVDGE